MRASRIVWVDRVPLVFGLDWVPLLGDPHAARAQARRLGASHRALSGDPPGALGFARGLPTRVRCWSVADLLARQHPRGTVACVLPLDTQSWHVLASHEGVALARADRSHPDPELAHKEVDALRLAYPRLQLLSPDPATGSEGLLQNLARQASAAPALEPVRRWGRWLVALGLVPAAVMLWAGRDWYASAGVPPPADTWRQAWEQAYERALAAQPVHGEQGTLALLQALYRQPARIAGWRLHSLRCQPRAGDRPWLCTGEYRRQGLPADNRGMLQAAPPGWRLDFPSLDVARASWGLSLPARQPDPQSLPTSPMLERDWSSALQAILPAFSVLRIEAPRPFVVHGPRDAQGHEIPPPAELPRLATRTLRVEGPLRSLRLLAPLAQSVSWQKATLSFAPGTRPGARTSRLILHLEGAVYENRP